MFTHLHFEFMPECHIMIKMVWPSTSTKALGINFADTHAKAVSRVEMTYRKRPLTLTALLGTNHMCTQNAYTESLYPGNTI